MEAYIIYPRLLRRVRAALIDSGFAIFIIITWWLSLPLLEEYPLGIKLAYPISAWFVLDPLLIWRLGNTPGHYIMNLRVQSTGDGRNISLLRAIIRSLLKTLTGFWSFIFVLMTRRHQSVHDVLTGTVVILREPELFPERERIDERMQDLDNYRYPSAIRKVLMITSYFILSVVIFGILMVLLLSEGCLDTNRCGFLDTTILFSLNIAWFFAVAALMIYGWQSRLYGARRMKIKE